MPAWNLAPIYVPLSGALMAPLNFTGPVNPICASGAAHVTEGLLAEDVVLTERVLEALVWLNEGLCVEVSDQLRVLELCDWLIEEV